MTYEEVIALRPGDVVILDRDPAFIGRVVSVDAGSGSVHQPPPGISIRWDFGREGFYSFFPYDNKATLSEFVEYQIGRAHV